MFEDDSDNWFNHEHGHCNGGGSPHSNGARWFVAGFGVLWTIMAIAITAQGPDEGPFIVAKYVFPAFGVLFILGALLGGRTHKPSQKTDKQERVSVPPGHSRATQSGNSPLQKEMKLICPRCGAAPTNPSVSPHGDVKCQYCGTWYNVWRQSD